MTGGDTAPVFTFCPRCATRLEVREWAGTTRPFCPSCSYVQYLNPVVGVAAVVRDAEGRVLMVRKLRGGIWSFPSGYVEWDEDIRDAIVREMREEVGLDAAVGDLIAVHSNFHNRDKQTVSVWFAATITGGVLRPDQREITTAKWFDPATPPSPTYPTDELVLAQLAAAWRS